MPARQLTPVGQSLSAQQAWQAPAPMPASLQVRVPVGHEQVPLAHCSVPGQSAVVQQLADGMHDPAQERVPVGQAQAPA